MEEAYHSAASADKEALSHVLDDAKPVLSLGHSRHLTPSHVLSQGVSLRHGKCKTRPVIREARRISRNQQRLMLSLHLASFVPQPSIVLGRGLTIVNVESLTIRSSNKSRKIVSVFEKKDCL